MKIDHNIIQNIIQSNKNYIDIVKELYGYYNGQKLKKLKEYIKEYNIDISHFDIRYRSKTRKEISKICTQCNGPFITKNIEQLTCSHKCSNKYFKDKRKVIGTKKIKCALCSKEIEVKKQADNKCYCDVCRKSRNRSSSRKEYKCITCGKSIKKTKLGYCRDCVSKTKEYRNNLKKGIRKSIENGNHKGWISRNITSYPEKFFIKVLKNNDIFSDCSTNYGIKVYRIPWKSINNDKGKKYIKEEISRFLEFYNNWI